MSRYGKPQALIVILACLFPFGATSAADPEIVIRQYSSDVSGHTLELDIRISNALNAGIKGYSLRLGYDRAILSRPVAVTEGTWSAATDEFLLRTEPLDGIGNVSIGAVFPEPSGISSRFPSPNARRNASERLRMKRIRDDFFLDALVKPDFIP